MVSAGSPRPEPESWLFACASKLLNTVSAPLFKAALLALNFCRPLFNSEAPPASLAAPVFKVAMPSFTVLAPAASLSIPSVSSFDFSSNVQSPS